MHVEIVLWVTARMEGHVNECSTVTLPAYVLNLCKIYDSNLIAVLNFNPDKLHLYVVWNGHILIFKPSRTRARFENLVTCMYNYRCWSSYLAANDGADLIIWRRGGSGDVRVAVAEAAGTVQIEAGWTNSWASHGCIMNRTSQPSRTWGLKTKQDRIWLIINYLKAVEDQ